MKPRFNQQLESLLSVMVFVVLTVVMGGCSADDKELREILKEELQYSKDWYMTYPANVSTIFIVDTISIPNPVIFELECGDYYVNYVVSDSIFRACYNPADSSFSREEYLLRYLQYHLDGYNYPPHSFLSTSDYFLQAEISVLANGYYNPFRDDFVFEPIPDSTHENKIPVDSIYFTIKPEAQIIDVFCYDPVIWRFRYENGKWIFVSHR